MPEPLHLKAIAGMHALMVDLKIAPDPEWVRVKGNGLILGNVHNQTPVKGNGLILEMKDEVIFEIQSLLINALLVVPFKGQVQIKTQIKILDRILVLEQHALNLASDPDLALVQNRAWTPVIALTLDSPPAPARALILAQISDPVRTQAEARALGLTRALTHVRGRILVEPPDHAHVRAQIHSTLDLHLVHPPGRTNSPKSLLKSLQGVQNDPLRTLEALKPRMMDEFV